MRDLHITSTYSQLTSLLKYIVTLDMHRLDLCTTQVERTQLTLYSKQRSRYRAVLTDQFVFIYDVAVDVNFIAGQAILHVICRLNYFSRPDPLHKQTPTQYGLHL